MAWVKSIFSSNCFISLILKKTKPETSRVFSAFCRFIETEKCRLFSLSLVGLLSLIGSCSCRRMAQNSDQKSWSIISRANMNNGVFIIPAPNSTEMSMILLKGKWPAIVIPLFQKNKSHYFIIPLQRISLFLFQYSCALYLHLMVKSSLLLLYSRCKYLDLRLIYMTFENSIARFSTV